MPCQACSEAAVLLPPSQVALGSFPFNSPCENPMLPFHGLPHFPLFLVPRPPSLLPSLQVALGSFPFNSQCEHHMLPFHGRALVAYVLPAAAATPAAVISREALEQIVRVYTRRLQVRGNP